MTTPVREAFQPRRLLVTGGAGFIGSNFLHWLWENGHGSRLERLVVLDALTYAGNLLSLEGLPLVHVEAPAGAEASGEVRSAAPAGAEASGEARSAAPAGSISFVRGSICDGELVRALFERHSFDAVVHLAAESHVDRSIEDGAAFVHTNVLGTFSLLDAALRAWKGSGGERRFVHVSTDEVYGALGESGVFVEESPYQPNSPYAASKAGADHLARAFFQTHDLPVVITNCSNNYGPRQFPEKLIPLMVSNARAGERLPVYGKGAQVRDWLHVSDHCAGLWAALTRGLPGEKYNFGGGTELPNLALVERIADAVDALCGRASGTARKLISFVPDRPGHDFRYAIDNTKASRELGWQPAVEFGQGLEATVRWYADNGDWVEATRSGEYRRFYEANYARRGGAARVAE